MQKHGGEEEHMLDEVEVADGDEAVADLLLLMIMRIMNLIPN